MHEQYESLQTFSETRIDYFILGEHLVVQTSTFHRRHKISGYSCARVPFFIMCSLVCRESIQFFSTFK